MMEFIASNQAIITLLILLIALITGIFNANRIDKLKNRLRRLSSEVDWQTERLRDAMIDVKYAPLDELRAIVSDYEAKGYKFVLYPERMVMEKKEDNA